MAEVNSRRESRALERDLEPPAQAQGAQPSPKNGRNPELFRADQRTERPSAQAVLAEGEELSSNPLQWGFNGLRSTSISVDVDWRILAAWCRSRPAADSGPPSGLRNTPYPDLELRAFRYGRQCACTASRTPYPGQSRTSRWSRVKRSRTLARAQPGPTHRARRAAVRR
jgi:hypothetical protein